MLAPQQPQQSNTLTGPQMAPDAATQSMQPQGQPSMTPQGASQQQQSQTPDQSQDQQGGDQDKQIVQALQQHLDQLGNDDKAFLAAHLTPEFVRAIGLINGPAVANYLNQYADPNKVLVPVPRQIATQVLAKIQKEGANKGGAPQGSPMSAGMQPSQPQGGAGQQPQGMMAPQTNAPATPQ